MVESLSYFNPSLDIAKWNQTVEGTAISGKDLFLSPQGFQDFATLDFLPKDDSASVSSMADSAYQSQPDANRRATTGFHMGNSQDSRSHRGDQYLGGELFSPSLSSDSYSTFQAQHSDMNQMMLPSAVTEPDLGDSTFRMSDFANYPTSQGYGHFTNTTMSQFTPTSELDVHNWASPDAQSFSNQYNTTNFRQPAQRYYSAFSYGNQDSAELGFDTSLQAQRHIRESQADTTTVSGGELLQNPTPMERHVSRRPSTADQAYHAFVMSPPGISQQQNLESDSTEQHNIVEPKPEKKGSISISIPPQLAKEEDLEDEYLSPSQAAAAQSLEEEQGKVARTHVLYQAQPGEDDLYHCPNEGQPGCNHKPTKLKCNYDKYVDSHLRPFRCKNKACIGVQFSSTACLLRHEREAHGMHGHGSKPHLCTYPDCERSMPGNGFPRRYNLFDHMKRVHDYTPTASPTERSPSAQSGQPVLKRQNSTRKRKSTTEEGTTEKRQKTKAAAQAVAAHNQLIQRRQNLQREFNKRIESLVLVLKDLQDPKELDGIQLTKDVVALQEIASQYRGLG